MDKKVNKMSESEEEHRASEPEPEPGIADFIDETDEGRERIKWKYLLKNIFLSGSILLTISFLGWFLFGTGVEESENTACYSKGARVLATFDTIPCTPYCAFSIFGLIPLSCTYESQHEILKRGKEYDSNYCMKGSQGNFIIELSDLTRVQEITFTNIRKKNGSEAENDKVVPKHFSVYGSQASSKEMRGLWILLGNFTYHLNGFNRQIFEAAKTAYSIKTIVLMIHSNYGGNETVLHHFGVLGLKMENLTFKDIYEPKIHNYEFGDVKKPSSWW